MSIVSMLFNSDKYIRMTRGDEVLIAIDGRTDILVDDNRTGANKTIEKHDPCLAWGTLKKYTKNGYNRNAYYIKSFIGDPLYPYSDHLSALLTNYNDVVVLAENAIAFGGVNPY